MKKVKSESQKKKDMARDRNVICSLQRWGILWREKRNEYLTDVLTNFRTKAECEKYIHENFGYIKKRDDLRSDPFCWKMPKAIRIILEIKKANCI